KFDRKPERVSAGTSLRVAEGNERFGAVFAAAYGMPDSMADRIGRLPRRPGWHCLAAYDGDEPVATGGALRRREARLAEHGGHAALAPGLRSAERAPRSPHRARSRARSRARRHRDGGPARRAAGPLLPEHPPRRLPRDVRAAELRLARGKLSE